MIGIYKITNPKGKVYIGQSWDIKDRKRVYQRCECKGQQKIYNSIKKYGWKNHIHEIVHELPKDISKFFNITIGCIYSRINGRKKVIKGFTWKYKTT